MRRIRSLLGWAALLALSCSSPTGVDGSAGTQVATVSLDVTATTVVVGTETPLHAAVIDVDGNVVPNAQVVWTVRDAEIASVSGAGVVTARAAGSTQVAASSGGRSAIANITVQLPPVATVAVQPAAPSLVVGASVTLTATLADAGGATLANRAVTWASSDVRVATVTAAGLLTAIAPGAATITAASEGKIGTAAVTVVRAPVLAVTLEPAVVAIASGQSRPLTVTVEDANHVIVTDREVKWTSSDELVASVSATGTVTARAPGAATITATSDGKSASTRVTVDPAAVGTVVVQPGTVSLTTGGTTTLTAVVTDVNGAPATGRAMKWTSSNGLAATVSATGVVTAVAAGSATITAESEGKTGSATVTVTSVPVASVGVEPVAVTVQVGRTITLTATVKDAAGNVLTGRAVSWVSSNPLVATVTSAGGVTAVAPGGVTISASVDGKSGSSTVTVTLVPVASVAVQPKTASLFVGGTTTLGAVVTDANGVVTSRAVTWTSGNESVASVSSTGIVTANGPGQTTITATSEGKSDGATVSVAPAPVNSVVVLPANSALTIGETTTLSATVRDTRGVTVTDRPVSWTSSNPAVAAVSLTSGGVTAVSVGSATISATSEGKTGTAVVSVALVPVGGVSVLPATASLFVAQTTALTATVRDANGTVVTDRPITWSSSNPLAATVSPAGVVSAVAPGTATISAAVGGKSGSSAVTVAVVPVGTVDVHPTTAILTVGQTATATAVVRDLNGTIVTDRVVTWSSSNPLAATVSGSGVVTAVAPGAATITATSEGRTGAGLFTIAPSPVGSVTLTPPNSSIAVGQTTPLAATVKDIRGITVTDRPLAWTSSDDAVATVSPSGVVTAVSVGTATITATSEGRSGSASVSVTAVPVASVTVQPATVNLFVGQTTVLLATVRDANGTAVTDRPITWTSSNSAVATVSATGVVTAVAPGSATVSASAGGRSGSAGVAVTLVPVGSVVLAPAAATVVAGQTTTLVPTIRDANGAVVTNRAVSWTTSNSAVATVSSSGVVTAVAPGDVTITATSEGKSGNASITVIPVPVGSVVVAPATKSIVVGTTTALAATVRDANGTIVANRVVTWSSSDPLVATVSSTGVVTGAGVGGPVTITATSEGRSGSSAVTVTPAPVASVTVQPPALTLAVGETAPVTAVLKDANGNVLTGRVVAWVSSNPLLATVSATGLVTAVAPTGAGPVFVTASSEGWNGSTAVTVTRVPVGTVTLPATATLVAGQSTTLTPVVRDANGTVVTDRIVTWSSSNTSIATVSSAGVVKALVTGSATITATSEGKSAGTALTVTPAPVGTVTVAPFATTIGSGSTVALVATVKDVNGTTVTDRTVTWKSSDDLVATVSTSGVVSGLKVGSTTITATSEGKSGTATITVVPGPAAAVTVTPPTATVRDGTLVQLTATAVDANGNAVTGRTFTWGSSDQVIATVSSSGRVSTKRSGVVTITATLDGKSDTSQITVTP